MIIKKQNIILSGILMLLLSGCVSTQHAHNMREIQQTKGFFTESLWYLGSTESYHYFDQSRCGLLPLKETTKRFRVPFSELIISEELVFPYESSTPRPEGGWSSNVRDEAFKVRISDGPAYAVVPRELRSDYFARKLDEKLDEKQRKLKASMRRVNNTLVSLYELQLPLSNLASSYHEKRNRWPTSIEEFKAFASTDGKLDGTINWASCEPMSISELADGSFEIKCTLAHAPATVKVAKSNSDTTGEVDSDSSN